MYVYELGNPNPVGFIPTTGSGGLWNEQRDDMYERPDEWTCHYCGSVMDGNSLKCRNCGGEKREMRIRVRGSARIRYVTDEEPVASKEPEQRSILWPFSRIKWRIV